LFEIKKKFYFKKFKDAYDLFIINLAMLMMGCVYYRDALGAEKNTVPVYIDTLVKASGQVGTLIGQLLFGYLADQLGRKRMYGVELMIIVVCTVASALSASLNTGLSVFAVLAIWRIFLGLGIGGDYPLSAIITSEFATTKRRGAMMAAVFAMQGFGILAAAAVAVIVLACFKDAVIADQNNLDYVWRICIGLGAVPGCLAIYFRLTIPETPRYTLDVDNNVDRATNDVDIVTDGTHHAKVTAAVKEGQGKASMREFCRHFGKWKNLKVLLGTSLTWFALDVAFYGINLNTGIILEAIGFAGNLNGDSKHVWESLFKNAVGNIIIALMGTVPGYW
jgi:PHS family inorganic phosphate transporter-like MFS transporter